MSQKLNFLPSATGGRQDYAPHLSNSVIGVFEDGNNGNMHKCPYWHTPQCGGWNSARMCSIDSAETCFYARAAGVAELRELRAKRANDVRSVESRICDSSRDLHSSAGNRKSAVAAQALSFTEKLSCCFKDIVWRLQTSPLQTWKAQLDESINSYFPILLEIENGRSSRR